MKTPQQNPRIAGPIFNQDSTEFFFVRTADQMSGETVDAYIDDLARFGVIDAIVPQRYWAWAACARYRAGATPPGASRIA